MIRRKRVDGGLEMLGGFLGIAVLQVELSQVEVGE